MSLSLCIPKIKDDYIKEREGLPKLLPESPRDVVLQPGGSQVSKDDLQLPKNPNVVFLPVL